MSVRLTLLATVAAAATGYADEVTNWNSIATRVAPLAGQNGIVQTRTAAVVHIAVHDALNAVDRRYRPYLMEGRAGPGASPEAAVATAARDALTALLGSRNDVEEAWRNSLAAVADGPAKTSGVAIGAAAAAAIVSRRRNDGSDATVTWVAGALPGQYRPTPPANAAALLPHWGSVMPFAVRAIADYRTAPPPDLFSERYAAELNEVRLVGAEASTARTPEGSEIARYWYEPSVQGWNRIARVVAEQRKLNLWDNARLFAALNVAMAEGFIAGFESKYYFNFWRPVTAIREADTDGNLNTEADPTWNSFLVAPAVPDWPSTHALLGAAAAAVLARVLATDFVSFEMTSGPPYPDLTRKFYSFSQAALENAHSRVLAGIHFRAAALEGFDVGNRIGEFVVDNYFKPVR